MCYQVKIKPKWTIIKEKQNKLVQIKSNPIITPLPNFPIFLLHTTSCASHYRPLLKPYRLAGWVKRRDGRGEAGGCSGSVGTLGERVFNNPRHPEATRLSLLGVWCGREVGHWSETQCISPFYFCHVEVCLLYSCCRVFANILVTRADGVWGLGKIHYRGCSSSSL